PWWHWSLFRVNKAVGRKRAGEAHPEPVVRILLEPLRQALEPFERNRADQERRPDGSSGRGSWGHADRFFGKPLHDSAGFPQQEAFVGRRHVFAELNLASQAAGT